MENKENQLWEGPAVQGEQEQSRFLPPALIQYWHLALRWRWVVSGIMAACFIAGLLITLIVASKYTAKAEIEISREQKQITNVQGVESREAGRDNEFYATQYALLKVRPLAERVARTLNLNRSQSFFEAHGRGALFNDPKVQKDPNFALRLAVGMLLQNVTITPLRLSRLVEVSYTSRSPELSAQIANAWVQSFISLNMDRQFASTADARRFLEQRLDALRDRLEESERQLVTYASRQGIVALDESRDGRTRASRTLVASDLEELNAALNRAKELRIAAQSRLSSNGSFGKEALSESLTNFRQARTEVASEYARQLVQYEPEHLIVRGLAQKLKEIDAAISRETSRISTSRVNEYKEAVDRERRLQQQVDDLKVRLDRQQHASIQYAIYQREADTNRQLYDALLQRYKEIGIAGTVGANNIAIVEPAQVPSSPSAPSLPLNLAVALLIGGLISAIAVFALEQVDEGIREPTQVKALLNLPLLGHTPTVDSDFIRQLKDAKSHLYEAYFSVRSNLDFATTHGFPRTLMVTSTQPAEGKSSTSLALAWILARTGKKVLLVDGDMRSPSVHEMLSGSNDVGLSNILAGENEWKPLTQKTQIANLQMLSAGPPPPNAAELLSGDRLAKSIGAFLEDYDHILIDSPPVLGLSDAPILSRAVEGCVYVVQAQGVAVRAIQSSLARLRMAHANILGIVLTKLEHREGSHGYGYGYGYGYGFSQRYGAESEAQS